MHPEKSNYSLEDGFSLSHVFFHVVVGRRCRADELFNRNCAGCVKDNVVLVLLMPVLFYTLIPCLLELMLANCSLAC
jgi:hypothetical protein